MKKTLLMTAVSAAALTANLLAGEATYAPSKEVTPPNPAIYGTGFYMGVQAGINAYQDFNTPRNFNVLGNDVEIDAKDKVGFVGGLKAGYVFGTGTVRPAIEADLYYNGVKADLDARVNGRNTSFNGEANLHSGAFMGNFLLRFAFDRFQPYLGGGVGAWVAQADDIRVSVRGRTRHVADISNNGFAWQIVGGADYYFAEKFSVFAEYKFLNYEDAGLSGDRLAQHLIVLGLRWHF